MVKKLFFTALIALLVFGASDQLFARGGSFGGGGRSFGGGGRSFSSPSRSYSSPSRSPSPSRSFSTPSSHPSSSSSWFGGSKKSAPPTTVNKDAARAMQQQSSKEKFTAHQQSKNVSTTPSVSSPSTSTLKYFRSGSSDQRVRALKRDLNYERMQNRDLRSQQMYGRYYSQPMPMMGMYHDPFNMFFWLWLMEQNDDVRAQTVYNHRDEMDPKRYEELMGKNKELETRVKELEAKGAPKDPNYVPPGMEDNKDLMYSDEVVKAAHEEENSSGFPWFWTIAGVMVLGGAYLVFFKKWEHL